MQSDEGMLILCIVGAMVIVINGGLLLLLVRGKPAKEMEIFLRTARTLRNPFKEQEDQQQELRRRVQALEEGSQQDVRDEHQ